ncbi:MAG: hypothetical protein WCG25_08945 [bacterium]
MRNGRSFLVSTILEYKFNISISRYSLSFTFKNSSKYPTPALKITASKEIFFESIYEIRFLISLDFVRSALIKLIQEIFGSFLDVPKTLYPCLPAGRSV